MIIHLAGNAILINGRIVQRCLICGYKLCDSKVGLVYQTQLGEYHGKGSYPTFTEGHFICQDSDYVLVDYGKSPGPALDKHYIPLTIQENMCDILIEE